MAQLYGDEDFPFPVVERLRQFGHDVLTAFEAGQANQSIADADQLAFAATLGHGTLSGWRPVLPGLTQGALAARATLG